MRTKAAAAAAAAANKAAVDEDEDEPKKIRSSRSKRRHMRRSSTESESPPRKRSKKSSKRTAHKKSKRSKVSSSRRRRRSPSPSPSVSSSSPSSVSRSSSERSVSPPPPRSRSRDVKKRKGRGRDRERDPKRRKARRSTSSSGTSSSSGSSWTRSKSSKRSTKDGTTRHKIEKDNRHTFLSEKNITDDSDRDEEALVVSKKGRDSETERYEKNVSLETTENPPYKNADETEDILPAGGASPVAEDLELILRQKALENFRKFREAASMSGKTDNGAIGKEMLTDSPQNAGTKVAGARSAAAPFQRQASSLGVRHPTGSPRSEGYQYGTSHSWKQESSAGMSRGAGSPRILEDGDTGGSTEPERRKIEATHSSPEPRSPQDGRNSRAVMHRLVGTPGIAASVNQRLGSSPGVSHVNGAPRIKSVVSIPTREGLDDCTTPQTPYENSAPVESSSQIRQTPIDINNAEGTNGDDRKRSEASPSDSSILSSADGKRQITEARIEDKDGSQFQKKTFSRMHDGETVEVSYKVYIPKKTPALARRKLQR